jgi:hypothetical protein
VHAPYLTFRRYREFSEKGLGKGPARQVILRFYVGSPGFMQVLAERLDAGRKRTPTEQAQEPTSA